MATVVYDLKFDNDGDIVIENNDLVIEESDYYHIFDILYSVPGWWKKYPLIGFDPYKYLNSRASSQVLKNEATKQLQSDGYKVNVLDIAMNAAGEVEFNVVDVERK